PQQAMADLLAYLTAAESTPRQFPGNEPSLIAASAGQFALSATKAAIHGQQIAFEPLFKNLGYWSGDQDHAVWKLRIGEPATLDVYLDYACPADSAGNVFALDGAEPALRGTVAATGGWDKYGL